MLLAPGGFVAVDVAADLRGPGTERPDVRREFADLAGLRVQRQPARCEGRPKSRVGQHGSVPDPVDGLDAVPDPNGVDSTPSAGRVDAGVDLQVKVTVGIT